MERKRFQKNDSGFICAHCGMQVEPLGYTSRDHCPRCLASLHVDVLPGDRANLCGGLLLPFRADPDPKRGYVLTYRCQKCDAVTRNKTAHDARVQPDDMSLIIALTAGEYNFQM